MKNKDQEMLTLEELVQKYSDALKTEDPELMSQVMAEIAEGILSDILEKGKDMPAVELAQKYSDALKTEDPELMSQVMAEIAGESI